MSALYHYQKTINREIITIYSMDLFYDRYYRPRLGSNRIITELRYCLHTTPQYSDLLAADHYDIGRVWLLQMV